MNFSKNVQDATDKELLEWVNRLDFQIVHLASDELTRRSIKRLNEAIERGSVQAESFSKTTEKLTSAMFVLAIVQLLIAVFQLILSFVYSGSIQQIVFGVFMILVTIAMLAYFTYKIIPKN